MKKNYINPTIKIVSISVESKILAGSDPTPNPDGEYDLGEGDGTDNRGGEGLGLDNGDAI